jgi:hypothetical protein
MRWQTVSATGWVAGGALGVGVAAGVFAVGDSSLSWHDGRIIAKRSAKIEARTRARGPWVIPSSLPMGS